MRKIPIAVWTRLGFFALTLCLLLPSALVASQKTTPKKKNPPDQATKKENKYTPQVNPPTVKEGKPVSLAAPIKIEAKDHPLDNGEKIDITIEFSKDPDEQKKMTHFLLERCGEKVGKYLAEPPVVPTAKDMKNGIVNVTVEKCVRGEGYYFRVHAVGSNGAVSEFISTESATTSRRQWFAGERKYFLLIAGLVCGSVVFFIGQARRGREIKIRKIAGLEAVEEAVGRATEMGRPCLFIPGIQDMNDIQTIAGLTVLSHVSEVAAEYGARIEVPTSRSLVMTAARETVESSFLTAGKPDEYNADDIYYVTDEQFGYVAYLSGMMVREKPAACFYMGTFFAESLILAETGNSIGAIQIAGTAMPAQLPFFVAACDYTLIGEEFFAASAYLSGDRDHLGSLVGQDVGKVIVALLMIVGSVSATLASVTGKEIYRNITDFFLQNLLK